MMIRNKVALAALIMAFTLSPASAETTFWSWLFRSYTVRISLRGTRQTVIHASGMARGKQAVDAINIRLRELLDSRAVVV